MLKKSPEINFPDDDIRARPFEEILINSLSALSKAQESRDPYTACHQQQVAFIALEIGKKMNLNHFDLLGLKLGAMLHDIGKIAIPSSILTKPVKLSDAEFDLVKMHPINGADIFSEVNFPWPIEDMILHHHERLDGSGYPDGLIGNAIGLEARIIAVADTFDAMACDRPYRKRNSFNDTIQIIKEGRNKIFDSKVVDAFLECWNTESKIEDYYRAINGSFEVAD